jgi:hypothetical protein
MQRHQEADKFSNRLICHRLLLLSIPGRGARDAAQERRPFLASTLRIYIEQALRLLLGPAPHCPCVVLSSSPALVWVCGTDSMCHERGGPCGLACGCGFAPRGTATHGVDPAPWPTKAPVVHAPRTKSHRRASLATAQTRMLVPLVCMVLAMGAAAHAHGPPSVSVALRVPEPVAVLGVSRCGCQPSTSPASRDGAVARGRFPLALGGVAHSNMHTSVWAVQHGG